VWKDSCAKDTEISPCFLVLGYTQHFPLLSFALGLPNQVLQCQQNLFLPNMPNESNLAFSVLGALWVSKKTKVEAR
jgi:hypothetical protein